MSHGSGGRRPSRPIRVLLPCPSLHLLPVQDLLVGIRSLQREGRCNVSAAGIGVEEGNDQTFFLEGFVDCADI